MGLVTRKAASGFVTRQDSYHLAQVRRIAKIQKVLPLANIATLLSMKQITMVLIRLRKCPGWSVPLMLACQSQVFSRRSPNDNYSFFVK